MRPRGAAEQLEERRRRTILNALEHEKNAVAELKKALAASKEQGAVRRERYG